MVLHPDFHGQHSLLGPILLDTDTTPIFLSVNGSGTSLHTLLETLQQTLNQQLGLNLSHLAQDKQAAETVAQALRAHSPVTLVLDAYDQTRQEEVVPFIVALVSSLSGGSRLILGGRELPTDLLKRDDLQDKAAVVPVDPDKMMLDYVSSAQQTVLEVRALGPGRVLINGRLIEQWDGVLPRTLFFYFVDRGMTTRDEIFHTFWPNLSTREATNVFHVTKRKISEILGTDLTVYWSGFYRISPELELHYDVLKFAEAVQNAAVEEDDVALALLQNAVELYHGPFLSTIEQAWVTNRRSELAMTYAEALAGLARIYRNRDDAQNALGCYLRAAATSPQREDLARSIMELYRDLGRPRDALDVYDRLESELQSTLSVPASPQTAELAAEIRAKGS
ncbi:AfsR/SARP family transcriptional regulator [Aggregatilinea lenta]|uniref:AfsR/SARP family transcriptional regulator n=1 Tax=Aggregatilinea lenta TaxID=913108 RepID=UPI000E5AE3FF|nr:bacterial transcriptional activator domain-containing protein [Aggregatilinea lenta]